MVPIPSTRGNRERVRTAVPTLSPRQQEEVVVVLLLHYVLDLGIDTIATSAGQAKDNSDPAGTRRQRSVAIRVGTLG